jgi:hypothetical protein
VTRSSSNTPVVPRAGLEEATGLLDRGFTRIAGTFDAGESWPHAIARLARSAAAVDPTIGTFASDISELAEALLTRRTA